MQDEEILEQYRQNGYAVVPDALSEEEVASLNDLIDADKEKNSDDWHDPKQGAVGNPHILKRYPEKMDDLIRHERTYPLFEEILGGDLRLAQFDIRDVDAEQAGNSGMDYHRDISYYGREAGGKIFDPDNPYLSTFACTITYLEDVHECCPCFTIVPGSHKYRSIEEAREEMGDDFEPVDIRADAGTAILYNITTYHRRTAGDPDCPHGRRTMHLYMSRESNPPLTEWYTVPEELAMSDDPETRKFYSQWTPGQIEHAKEHYEEVPAYYP